VELGLKARDSADVIREYLMDLVPTMAVCGLRFPALGSLGVAVPGNPLSESG
jgi:hypothetical protein